MSFQQEDMFARSSCLAGNCDGSGCPVIVVLLKATTGHVRSRIRHARTMPRSPHHRAVLVVHTHRNSLELHQPPTLSPLRLQGLNIACTAGMQSEMRISLRSALRSKVLKCGRSEAAVDTRVWQELDRSFRRFLTRRRIHTSVDERFGHTSHYRQHCSCKTSFCFDTINVWPNS